MDGSYLRPDWDPASEARLLSAHTSRHIEEVRGIATSGGGWIEADTFICPESFNVALMAAGAVCNAITRVHLKEDKLAFCLVRPPGHHAASDHAAGFCLLNNVAIGARVATRELGYDRVLIVDWDVHHGDGTQAIFWEDPKVGYFSMHRENFYPFTGSAEETGGGAGRGATRNLPIRFGTSPKTQLEMFEEELADFANTIQPQLVIISAGFDAHKDDPIGSLQLESTDFAEMTRVVANIAERFAEGRIVSVLEGGYNPKALAECVEQHISELLVEE